jgi:DNA-binding CsgD family transcriptional regulator
VIGTTDDGMLIDRVALGSEGSLGYEPAEVLGRSILSLVDGAHVFDMVSAFQEALRTRAGVATAVGVRTKEGKVQPVVAVVVPMIPAPSSAFAFVPQGDEVTSQGETAGQRLVQRLRDSVPDAAVAPRAYGLRAVSRLTPRELDIVRRVVTGDRVRAIAERLFLSQSTVRNHLSSVYRKLGLRSQQELVDRFRVTELGPMDGESG